MKILVTGGAGFIASHVADRYIAAGHEVTIVDNLASGNRKNLNPAADFRELDIRDSEGIAALFAEKQFEVINHHAAQMDVRKSVDDPQYDADVNILGSLNLLLNALKHNVRKVIYISTGGAVYGEPKSLPVKEGDPVNPECPYGITKHTVEHYLYLYRFMHDLDYTVLRYPNVYGPRQSPHGEAGVIAIFAGMMLEGKTPTVFGYGTPERDYVYVGDVAVANELALDRAGGEIINLGSCIGTPVMALYTRIAELLEFAPDPKQEPLRPGEIEGIYLSGEKARDVLGWTPAVTVEDGLKQTVDWLAAVHKGNPWR